MKYFLAFLLTAFLSINSFAQGNLQFNQVLILDASTSGIAHTVPAGKVWKIESVAMSSNNAYFQIQWAGLSFFIVNTSSAYNNLPFWLPSSAAVTFIASATTKVSVIEFNVVP
jgi:hypothetical protein